MMRLLLLIFLLSGFSFLYAQDEEMISTQAYYFNSWGEDWGEPLKEAVVFADACKLRSKPSSGSEMLAKLLIGDKVKILEISDVDTTINGIQSKWIEVESGKKKGYVWGGLLTNEVLRVSDTASAVWGITKIVKGNDTIADKYYASVRIFSRKQVRKQLEFEVTYGDQPGFAELMMVKHPMLEGVEHVFIYHTIADACGVAWSNHYLIEMAAGMNYLDVGSGMGDGGVFHTSTDLIFPTEEKEQDYMIPYQFKPEKNQILKVISNDEYDENCIWVEHTTVETFEWKEGQMIHFCRD